jgi:hypothetical protein
MFSWTLIDHLKFYAWIAIWSMNAGEFWLGQMLDLGSVFFRGSEKVLAGDN